VEFFWDFAWHAAQLFLLVGVVVGLYILARRPMVLSIVQSPRRLARRAFLALHEHFVLRAIFRHELLKLVRRLIGHQPKP
jgi:hypothetical protein